PARLLQLRRSAGPGTPSALTAIEVLALRHGRFRLPGPPRRPGLAAQVPPRVGPLDVLQPGFLAAARARGIEVHAWTVNRRAEMIRVLDLGVDAIITDRADLLRDVLTERGQWRT
ncbi:MAG TPA: glycerophosphodiester phosphodiesterase family protein, partial [Jatrophihabitans sp.]